MICRNLRLRGYCCTHPYLQRSDTLQRRDDWNGCPYKTAADLNPALGTKLLHRIRLNRQIFLSFGKLYDHKLERFLQISPQAPNPIAVLQLGHFERPNTSLIILTAQPELFYDLLPSSRMPVSVLKMVIWKPKMSVTRLSEPECGFILSVSTEHFRVSKLEIRVS
jgi:hypothetical protein